MRSMMFDDEEPKDTGIAYTHSQCDPYAPSNLPPNAKVRSREEVAACATGNSVTDEGLVSREPMMGQGFNDQFPFRGIR